MKKFNYFPIVKLVVVFTLIFSFNCNYTSSQKLAFPGAEGFGAFARGGRGGDVYTVTTLNDDGPGSLRSGIESANGPRTIVFAVSGLIKLKSSLEVNKNYITIAGQTAPGDGICLRDECLVINANNIIVRYIRSRLGAEGGKEADAISISGGHNIILDHCSASWSVDECFSCSTGDPKRLGNVTVQWSIISEALNKSIHHKGPHGYGALIRGCYGAKYTYHHNLFAHNVSRNPRPGNYDKNNYVLDPQGLLFDFRNNVMYNWRGSTPGYDSDKESVCRFNYVGNYIKPGHNSDTSRQAYAAGCKYFRAFFSGNSYDGTIPDDQWSLVRFGRDWTQPDKEAFKQTTPFPSGNIVTESSTDAFNSVLNHAGASLVRDAVDIRLADEVRTGKGAIINFESEVGGWPVYKTYNILKDKDKDGMPDNWEKQHGLNPDDPEDRNGIRNQEGYTNLEIYLNNIVLSKKTDRL